MPTTEEALVLLAKIRDERVPGYKTQLSVKRDCAGLEIFIPGSEDKVVVYSPGDRWVSIDVPGKFSTLYLEEGMSEVDFIAWLHRYFDVAISYLKGRYFTPRSRVLRIPRLIVETGSGPVELNLGPKAAIRAALNRGGDRNSVDEVLVTVTLSILREARHNVNDVWDQYLYRELEDGTNEYRLGRFTIRQADSTARQEQFVLELEKVHQLIGTLEISPPLIHDFDGGLDVHVTLVPESGQAGVVIPSHLLQPWSVLNMNIFFDALRV